MKAVIVELNNGYAAALTDDGCIKKLQNKNYAIGQVIEMKAHSGKKIAAWAASAAAAVLLCSTTVWAYVSPYTYVSLDVNPSIEFSVNRFERVLSVTAVNDDGAEILQSLQLKHMSIKDAIREAVQQIAKEGYFSGEEPGGVVVATSCSDEKAADSLAGTVKDAIIETTKDVKDAIIIESESVGYERVQRAKELGVTPGKLNLVEKLKEASPDPDSIDINEWLKKPVKDIMKATKEYRKDHKQKDRVPGSSEALTPGSSRPEDSSSSEAVSSREPNKDKNGNRPSDYKGNGKKDSSSAISSEKQNGNNGKGGNSNSGKGDNDDKTAGHAGGNGGEKGNAGGKKDK